MDKKTYETPVLADVEFAGVEILMASGLDEYEGPQVPLNVGKF